MSRRIFEIIQEFSYESDSIDHFLMVLDTIAPIMWGYQHQCEHPFLFTEEPNIWQDGKDYAAEWESQAEVLTLSANEHVVHKPCRTFHGARFHEQIGKYTTAEEAAKVAVSYRKETKPTRKWLATIANFENPRKGLTFLRGFTQISQTMRSILERVDKEAFRREFRHCEPDTDGSMHTGYRMEWRPYGPANILDFSAVHIIVGK